MIFYPHSAIAFFLYSLIVGFIIGMIFDVFRLLRCCGLNNSIFVFFEDIIFCLISVTVIFIFTFAMNEGVFRSYELFGIIAGFLIYYNTFGRLVMAFSEIIINAFKKFFSFLFIIIKNTIDKFYKRVKILF